MATTTGSEILLTTTVEKSCVEEAGSGSAKGDSEDNSDRNGADDGEEDDGDDLVRASRRVRSQDRQDEDGEEDNGPHRDATSTEIKLEEETDGQGAIRIKREPGQDGDEPALDTILPTEYRWKTVYVAAFELALDTVLPEESFLFTDEDQTLFETYRSLPGKKQCSSQ